MGRVLGDSGEVEGRPGDTLVTSIDAARAGRRGAAARRRPSRPPARPSTRSRSKNYVADSGAVVVMDAKNGRVVAMAGAPDVRPEGLGRRHHVQAARPALLGQGRQPAAVPGDPGPVRARLDVEADHDDRRAEQRVQPEHPARLLVGLPGRQPVVQELRVRRPTGSIGFDQALQISCDTFFYRVGYGFWQKYGTDEGDVNAKDPLVEDREALRLRQAHRHRPPRRGQRPDRRPALEEGLLGGQQGLLLQARQEARQRLPPRVRARVLRRRLRLPRR